MRRSSKRSRPSGPSRARPCSHRPDPAALQEFPVMEVDGDRILSALRAHGGALLDELAGEPGVWVVGGAVRDVLLDREPRELDLVVEGDAIALARRLGHFVVARGPVGTANVHGTDLVTARSETYAAPGALPDVRPSGIDDDLARRDFTVNTLAVRLADGTVRSVPGAIEDLEARVLRVLHPGSF